MGLGLVKGVGMRTAYQVVARLIALGVIVQAAAIALGVFLLIREVEDGGIIDKDYEGNLGFGLHALVGLNVVPLLALILLVISFFAKVPGGIKWALSVVGLVILQIVLAFVSFGVAYVGALHAINAFAILAVAELAARRAKRSAEAVTAPVAANV
jgi:hypothetical protein